MTIQRQLRITFDPSDAHAAIDTVIPSMEDGFTINTSQGDISLHGDDAKAVMELVHQLALARCNTASPQFDKTKAPVATEVTINDLSILKRLQDHGSPVRRTTTGYELDRGEYLCRTLDMARLDRFGLVSKDANEAYFLTENGAKLVADFEREQTMNSELGESPSMGM